VKHAVLICLALLGGGCGYVGDPLSPALNIPQTITDLRAVQHAASLRVQFTAPVYSGENLLLKSLSSVEIRVGPEPFDLFQPPATPGAPVQFDIPAARYAGREVRIEVRCAGPTRRFSNWSNTAALTVIAPLPKPAKWNIEGAPDGVRLSWTEAPGARVYRQAEGDTEPRLLASGDSSYLDSTAEFGKSYSYQVQYTSGTAESEISEARRFTYTDAFAPAAPTGLQGLAGVNAIELNWNRSTEPDLRGYQVYRATAGGAFAKLGEPTASTSFRDTQVQTGIHYRYRLTALDLSGNESEPSSPLEIIAP
jgi:hypothetical protein